MRGHRHGLCFSVWSAGYLHTWVTVKKADFLRCDLGTDIQTISLGNVWLDNCCSGHHAFLRCFAYTAHLWLPEAYEIDQDPSASEWLSLASNSGLIPQAMF